LLNPFDVIFGKGGEDMMLIESNEEEQKQQHNNEDGEEKKLRENSNSCGKIYVTNHREDTKLCSFCEKWMLRTSNSLLC
jgi:hypothetical protein